MITAFEERLRNVRSSWCKLDKLAEEDPESVLALITETMSLLDSIQLLPDQLQRIVLTGYYFCRFTEKQIAEDCRLSRKTVYRVKRAAVKSLGEMHG